MTKIYVISDTHFGHGNIIKFMDDKGVVIRQHPEGRVFNSVQEHDELIIQYWNETVTPEDIVYHLGDVAINKQIIKHGLLKRLLGKKRLVRGNHDICDTRLYLEEGFQEIFGVRVFQPGSFKTCSIDAKGIILSHIPIHPGSIKPGWVNVHGHLHAGIVRLDGHPDERYWCVSLEHTDYKPILLLET